MPPAYLITGGETTLKIRGGKLGGRNQAFVPAAALDFAGRERTVVFSAGTGGATDTAGAVADRDTLRRNPDATRDLNDNGSYHVLVGAPLPAGHSHADPTGTLTATKMPRQQAAHPAAT